MAAIPATAHWRDSARQVQFFFIDFRAAFPFLFFLLHIRMWTFVLALIMMMFFGVLSRFGFTIAVFGRWMRLLIAGSHKYARPWWSL